MLAIKMKLIVWTNMATLWSGAYYHCVDDMKMLLFHHDDNRHHDMVPLNGIFEIDSHLLAAIGDNLVLFSLFLLEELNAELPYKAAYKKHDIVNLLTKIYS